MEHCVEGELVVLNSNRSFWWSNGLSDKLIPTTVEPADPYNNSMKKKKYSFVVSSNISIR